MIDNDEKELIAQFMEWEIIPEAHGVGRRYRDTSIDKGMIWFLDEFKFHYSWDWLMPVVEKIESMGYRTTLFCHEYGKEDGNSMHIKDSSHTMLGDGFASTKIEAVYKAVVEFIKWYNENKKA